MEEQNRILLETIKGLNTTIASLSENHKKEVESLNQRIKELTAQVAYLNRQLFGRKAEKLPHLIPGQLDLFADQFIRRHLEQALDENRPVAEHLLTQIQHLYKIERICDEANLSFDERMAKRNELARPIMEAMKVWMETEGVKYSESSLIGKAITYAYTRWDNMMHYLDDGRLLLDNNLAENEIRPITLGRKNYLFCGNHEAAGNMCIVNSLLATCRNHNVNPRLYLNDIISRMPYITKTTHEEFVELLPHKWKLTRPDAVMTKLRGTTTAYREMLETNPNPIQEPYEVWHQQMVGMAMGKYPQRILAHRRQSDSAQSHNE